MIYYTGDVHGRMGWHKLMRLKHEVFKKKNEDNYLVVCGDFSFVWFGDKRDMLNIGELEHDLTYTILWVGGKHENYDALKDLDQYPMEEKYGGTVQKISPHIYRLLNGSVYEVDGKKIFAMGGGVSPDRAKRKEGTNWWPEEMPTEEDIANAREVLEKHGNKVDVVVTHSAPYTVLKAALDEGLFKIPWDIGNEDTILGDFLDEVAAMTEHGYWFCGCYHVDHHTRNDKFRFLFNNLERAWTKNANR